MGGWQRILFAMGAPVAKAAIRRGFALTQRNYEEVRARLEIAVSTLSETLGDPAYFVGDRFTAADLTAAAILSPLVLPLPAKRRTPPDPGAGDNPMDAHAIANEKPVSHTREGFDGLFGNSRDPSGRRCRTARWSRRCGSRAGSFCG